MITFRTWLRTSNEAKPFRDAMALNDQMPIAFGLKSSCFDLIQWKIEAAWEKTKEDLA